METYKCTVHRLGKVIGLQLMEKHGLEIGLTKHGWRQVERIRVMYLTLKITLSQLNGRKRLIPKI